MSDEAIADGMVGTRLKALREAAGLSQRALADRAGVAPETVARLERDRTPPRAGTVRKVAAALGVPPDALAGGSGTAGAEAAAGDLRPALRAALVGEGVALGPAGDDAARGWHATVEELATSRGGRLRYHALVFGPAEGSSPSHASARARGATEAEALAKALVRLVERTG
jgi:transcriptional regulator with XRE-family HTH domain